MVIHKKLLRTGRAVRRRLIGCLVILCFSVGLMVSFRLAMQSVAAELSAFRDRQAMHDLLVQTATPITSLADAEFEARAFMDVNLSDGKTLHITTLTANIDLAAVTEGRGVAASGELLLDRLFAQKNDIAVGDQLCVLGKVFTVCGFYASPDTVLPAKTAESILVSADSFGLAAMSADDMQTLGTAQTEYLVRCEQSNSSAVEAVRHAIDEQYTLTDCKLVTEDNRATYIDGDIKLFSEDLQVLPVIFIIIASFACAAVVSRIMKAETVQMGVLSAFGYRKRTLYAHYMAYPLAVTLGGVLLGCVAGIALAPAIASIQDSRYLLPAFVLHLDCRTFLQAATIPFVCMGIICSVFVLASLRRTPLELMRNEKTVTKRVALAHLKLRRLPFRVRFVVRQLLRNLPRELFLVGGIALSSMLLLLYGSMLSSLSGALNESFDQILQYEYQYTFSTPQSADYGENCCYLNSGKVLLCGDYIDMTGTLDTSHLMHYTNADGSETDFSQTVITNHLARKYDIQEGDTVTLQDAKTGAAYVLRIDKICVSYLENFISVPLAAYNEMTHQPRGAYQCVAAKEALNIEDDGALSKTETLETSRKAVDQTLRPLYVLLAILLTLAAVVAFMLIVIVTSVILEESGHAISLLQVLGYHEKRIAALVLDANAIAVAMGYVLGIPLTKKLTGAVFAFLSDTLGMYIPAQLRVSLCLVGFVCTMVIFLAVKWLMQRKILSVSAADALKARE